MLMLAGQRAGEKPSSFVQAGIDGVAEAVADEIEGNHRQKNEDAGPEDPGMLIELDDVHGLVEHVSPGGGGLHDSQTENGKGRLAQDVSGNAQSSRYHHVSECVGQDVSADDPAVVQADGSGGSH